MKADSQIALFLFNMKRFIERNGFIFVEREASKHFLADRNMGFEELESIILSLTVKDCFDGPEPDRDVRFAKRWTVAEFSPWYEGEQLYLKMSIKMESERVKCLSVKLYTDREFKQ